MRPVEQFRITVLKQVIKYPQQGVVVGSCGRGHNGCQERWRRGGLQVMGCPATADSGEMQYMLALVKHLSCEIAA